ncbi:MAG TPA: signal recognition particle-docking protein FtsY [Salinarimonas sp.]|nr:signal recognition particle-docking protein FtsY [Salinarimonas sp.]
MSDTDKKPGFLSRLFGRGAETPKAPDAPATAGDTPAPGSPASRSEGEPDLTTAAAAGEIAPVTPTATTDSPDIAPHLPPELAGADLQPGEGQDRPEEAPGPGKLALEPTISTPGPAATPEAAEARGWWRRLTEGLSRTSSTIGDRVTSLFTKRKLDATTLEDLEDVLIQADLGIEMASRITGAVGRGRYEKGVDPEAVKAILAAEVERVLEPVAKPLMVDRSRKPFVVLMVGVNGAGKTTTIGKLAAKAKAAGLKPMLAAGDTFRAAAIDQLKVWGERVGAPVIAREQGADAAGLAYDAMREARERGCDVLFVDTAGRLQNKAGLMAELEKVVRVMRKVDETAPHATLLVLDATVGQNAVNQVEVFGQSAGVTGLVMTKLDGTARGGILVAIAERFKLPVHYIGVGEAVADLEPFAARDFARAIAGLDEG